MGLINNGDLFLTPLEPVSPRPSHQEVQCPEDLLPGSQTPLLTVSSHKGRSEGAP